MGICHPGTQRADAREGKEKGYARLGVARLEYQESDITGFIQGVTMLFCIYLKFLRPPSGYLVLLLCIFRFGLCDEVPVVRRTHQHYPLQILGRGGRGVLDEILFIAAFSLDRWGSLLRLLSAHGEGGAAKYRTKGSHRELSTSRQTINPFPPQSLDLGKIRRNVQYENRPAFRQWCKERPF